MGQMFLFDAWKAQQLEKDFDLFTPDDIEAAFSRASKNSCALATTVLLAHPRAFQVWWTSNTSKMYSSWIVQPARERALPLKPTMRGI